MKLNAYTLYDIKSETYSPPFWAVSHGAATRIIMDVAADPNTTVGRHPVDFTLICIGTFDDGIGLLQPFEAKQHVADVATLAPKPEPLPLFPTGVHGPVNGSRKEV